MQALIALLLFGQQMIGAPGYTLPMPFTDSPEAMLVMESGRYTVELGAGCDDLVVGQNVQVLAGSGGVASIVSPGSEYQCVAFISDRLSDDPCRTDDAGVCDVALEQGGIGDAVDQ